MWVGLFSAQAQDVLAAGTYGNNEMIFLAGDGIVFKTWSENVKRDDIIKQLHPTFMVLSFDTIPYHEVKAVYFTENQSSKWAGLLFGLGVAYWSIDSFNRVLVQKQDFVWDEDVLKVSGALMGSGMLLSLLRKRKIKFSGRNQLRMLELIR